MGAPAAELDDRTTCRRLDDPCGLTGDRGLKHDRGQKRGLDKLGLGNRRGNPQQRLHGKDGCSLGNRPDLPGEAKGGQIFVKKPRRRPIKRREAAQILDLRRRKAELLEPRQRLLEPGGHEKPPIGRQVAHEQLEGGPPRPAAGEVAGRHRDFIQVRRKGRHHGLAGAEPAPLPVVMYQV